MTRDPQITPELLTAFAEPTFDPVTVTIADLVTVCVDANFQVVEVALHPRDVVDRQQVEVAVREVINEAIRQVTQRNAARLSDLMARDDTKHSAAL